MREGKITIWKGNGMGIVISAEGITIIPPCDPQVLAAMRAITDVQRVRSALPVAVQAEAGTFMGRLASFVFEAVDKAVGGGLDAASGVVFQDEGEGFTCGSTGGVRPLAPTRPVLQVPVERVVVGKRSAASSL